MLGTNVRHSIHPLKKRGVQFGATSDGQEKFFYRTFESNSSFFRLSLQ
jgi:hypothetical protein